MLKRIGAVVVASLLALTMVGATEVSAVPQCDDIPLYCQPVNGTIHDGTGEGVLPQVPGDPFPGTAGVWLGHLTSARYCYANYNSFAVDSDHDWLDDECEVTLARAFAPALAINPNDGCARGEPYWAAKYIDDPGFGWGELVRLAYMPAYYHDCGSGSHAGDSEFVMIAIEYNSDTQHWQLRDGWLSAHAGALGDSSDYVHNPSEFGYPARYRTYPRLWVAKSKHANYRNQDLCEAGGLGTDTCAGNTVLGRIRVYHNRNVGSRFLDKFPNGTPSANALYANNGRREHFYTSHRFAGWQPNENGATPYVSHLAGGKYECLDEGSLCYYGPGPNAPTSTILSGVIDGVAQATRYQTYTWTTFATGGALPYRTQWWRKYASDSVWTLVGAANGTGPFHAGSWTGTVDRCEDFTLQTKIFSSDSQAFYDLHSVAVTSCPPPPPPPLSAYVSGPAGIAVKGIYTYSAVHSGFSGPTFTWSERFCDDATATACGPWSTISGLGSTFNRTLNPDCSGNGRHTFQLQVVVRNSDGRTVTDEHVTALCELP